MEPSPRATGNPRGPVPSTQARPAAGRPVSAQDGDAVIIGAGPAGLTAAYQLAKSGRTSTVLEADSVVGGISRTTERDGWRFDMGGHRFFTKVPAVEQLWHEILPEGDFLLRPRMSEPEGSAAPRAVLRRRQTRCQSSARRKRER